MKTTLKEIRKMVREEIKRTQRLNEDNFLTKLKNMSKNLKFPKVTQVVSRTKFAREMDKLLKSKLNKQEQKDLQGLLMKSVMGSLSETEKNQMKVLWLKVFDNAINPEFIGMAWYPFNNNDIGEMEEE